MPKVLLTLLLCFVLLPTLSLAQASGDGQFGCPERTQFFAKPSLDFVPLAADAIERWQPMPHVSFSGFDARSYGVEKVAIYAWRSEVQASGESDQDPVYRLSLAVQLSGPRGDRWYQLVQPQGSIATAQSATPDELLYMQANANMISGHATDQDPNLGDMAALLSIRLATPVSSLPLFLLDLGYRTTGTEAEQVVSNRLLLDVRAGKPKISRAVQCQPPAMQSACDVPGQPRAGYDNLRCSWDASVSDFRCTLSAPFGSQYAIRTAARSFYLLSSRPAQPGWYTSQTPPELRTLALQLARSGADSASNIMVPEIGPVTLLAHYKDLLPGHEVMIFSSPGAGATVNAHLWLVDISAPGGVAVNTIPKWVLSGERTDETDALAGYTPTPGNDRYHASSLEDRAGFHALQAVMSSDASSSPDQDSAESTHVVYWIGVEGVNGRLVASAVRVASDGSTYGSCAADSHDGTAISIEPQSGMAAATVHVRPAESLAQPSAPQTGGSDVPTGCVWIGGLYWKPGTGFQVRRLDQDCDAGMPHVSISDDGQISLKADTNDQEQ